MPEQSKPQENFGLQDDCPPFPRVYEYSTMVAGASITAAEELIRGNTKIAINWMGGRHHAKKDEAAGFCYVNDIVLAILCLLSHFKRVLYIDIDVHHGDGVEEAFYYTDKVLCISLHHRAPGYYPGTGRVSDVGAGKGKYYTINVPLRAGITDESYTSLFEEIVSSAWDRFQPLAVVMQCGLDGLANDPLGAFNLTPAGIAKCVMFVKNKCEQANKTTPNGQIPLLLLGGGGYHRTNFARALATLTAALLSVSLPLDIPEHKYFSEYKDNCFRLEVLATNQEDQNEQAYLSELKQTVINNIAHIKQV